MRPGMSAPSGLAQWPRQGLMALVRGYRLLLSPWLGSQCRFEPTCSRYALQALEQHGAAAGSYLTAARLLRCHPWCAGGHDAVPSARPRLFSRLLVSATVTPAAPAPIEPSSSSRLSS
eukprot:gene52832-70630_t